jgi:hypothetical protein
VEDQTITEAAAEGALETPAGGLDPYTLGAALQFLSRHSDIHYDRSAISLATRLSYPDATAALDQLAEWGLVNGRQATIGVRVFGLIPADRRAATGPDTGVALIVDADRTAGIAAARCLEPAGWRVVAVPEMAKGGFILREAVPVFALIDSLAAESGLIPWDRFDPLGLAAAGIPALLWTNRQEVDEALARQHNFAGIARKPLDCAALVAAGRQFRDLALTRG